jgi:hypothetical protein
MANLEIERLSLKLSGLSPGDGERLAQLVANALAQSPLAGDSNREMPAMNINLQSTAGSNLNRLSEQIVGEIRRQLS